MAKFLLVPPLYQGKNDKKIAKSVKLEQEKEALVHIEMDSKERAKIEKTQT